MVFYRQSSRVRLYVNEALPAFAAASIDEGAAASGFHASAEADFADSFYAMWSICRSHV